MGKTKAWSSDRWDEVGGSWKLFLVRWDIQPYFTYAASWAYPGKGESGLSGELWEKPNYYKTLGDRKGAMEGKSPFLPSPSNKSLHSLSSRKWNVRSVSWIVLYAPALLSAKPHSRIKRLFCDLPLYTCMSSIAYIPREYSRVPQGHAHAHAHTHTYRCTWVHMYIHVSEYVITFGPVVCMYVCLKVCIVFCCQYVPGPLRVPFPEKKY